MNIKTKNAELDRLAPDDFKQAKKAPVHIILDNIRSAQNVGSVFRTMDAFRCMKVHLCGITARPPHREINKTALGASETVSWAYYKDTKKAVEQLQSAGIEVFAIEQTSQARSLLSFEQPIQKESAFIFGNEVEGVQQEIINIADGSIELEQFGSKHSLNISVCTGIVLWHFCSGFKYWKE
jgi:tRNA G18 (ribose-2'-O)-methylase SpoU